MVDMILIPIILANLFKSLNAVLARTHHETMTSVNLKKQFGKLNIFWKKSCNYSLLL